MRKEMLSYEEWANLPLDKLNETPLQGGVEITSTEQRMQHIIFEMLHYILTELAFQNKNEHLCIMAADLKLVWNACRKDLNKKIVKEADHEK